MITLFKEIEITKTGLLTPLMADYLAQKQALSYLYKYSPSLPSFGEIMREKSRDEIDRKLLVQVLQSQYESIPASELVTKNIDSLLHEKTFTVVASHQPCLFLGPLFNIYKI